jgi:ABC-type lipoprotein export system ATPase subunit
LDRLSLGEKCSAILSLVLVTEDRPLVIDEPEAELDHDFICNNVVESIRGVKGRRQVIICTHNPNIPVLGDAELVVKGGKVAGEPRCRIDHTGGFEHETSLHYLKQLEGGEEALLRRSAKYQLQ